MIKIVKDTVPLTYVIYEKVIKSKGDKLYVKSKGYDNSFSSWKDKREIT